MSTNSSPKFMASNTSFAYTAHFPIYRDRIVSMVNISSMRDGAKRSKPFKCLWDTGASMSLVSPAVAESLRLHVVDETITIRSGLGSTSQISARVAFLHIVLGAIPIELKVGVVDKPSSDDDIDAVLGLDLISQGSFAISYDCGRLLFSFCYPPAPMPIDFTRMLPLLGLTPAIVVNNEADNEDPLLSSDASVNDISARFNALLSAQKLNQPM